MTERNTNSGWRPIETAPKDGKRILIWPTRHGKTGRETDSIGIVYWHQPANPAAKGMWIGTGRTEHPTHWMPLPEAPL